MDTKSSPENACLNVDSSLRNVRIGLLGISVSKPPLVEFDRLANQWRVWTSYNSSVTLGTYMSLLDHGKLERVTVNPDYSLSITTL